MATRNIEYFAPVLNRASTFSDGWLRSLNTNSLSTTYLENGILSFQEIGGMNTPENKMLLTKEDFLFYYEASYRAIYLQLLNSNGRIELNSQNGIKVLDYHTAMAMKEAIYTSLIPTKPLKQDYI